MKYTHLVEQDYRNAASLALTYLRPQLSEEGFDVAPSDVPAGWMREDCFERAVSSVRWFLRLIFYGTTKRYYSSN